MINVLHNEIQEKKKKKKNSTEILTKRDLSILIFDPLSGNVPTLLFYSV